MLAAVTSAGLLVMAATPLGAFWFGRVSALPPALVSMASFGLWLGFVMPALSALQSLYQGIIVHSRRTRAVTESMILYLLVLGAVLLAGMRLQWIGLDAGLASATLGAAAQVVWLWWRARRIMP